MWGALRAVMFWLGLLCCVQQKEVRMRSVLGADLGASWHTLGSAVLSFDEGWWICCISGAMAWPDLTCNAGTIADAIIGFALKNNIRASSLRA